MKVTGPTTGTSIIPPSSIEFGADPGGLNISLEWTAPQGVNLQLQYATSVDPTSMQPLWQNFGSPWVSTGGAAVTSSNRIAWQLLSS